MSQLRHQQHRLDELKVQVKVVAFDSDLMAQAYAAETNLAWPLLLDRARELYAAYGMSRGSWWSIYNPVSVARYIWLIMTGKRPGKPGEDWLQMGGDVLIDPQGIVRLHHISSDPHDRPSVEQLLETVAQLA